jgi:hypothetical protein
MAAPRTQGSRNSEVATLKVRMLHTATIETTGTITGALSSMETEGTSMLTKIMEIIKITVIEIEIAKATIKEVITTTLATTITTSEASTLTSTSTTMERRGSDR